MLNGGWHDLIEQEPDGSWRVAIVDEDGLAYPVARKMTRGQAQRLVAAIAAEMRESQRQARAVIRDPDFMAATVLTIKRQKI